MSIIMSINKLLMLALYLISHYGLATLTTKREKCVLVCAPMTIVFILVELFNVDKKTKHDLCKHTFTNYVNTFGRFLCLEMLKIQNGKQKNSFVFVSVDRLYQTTSHMLP